MGDSLWVQLLYPYLSGLLLSFAIEWLLRPRPVPVWRRGWPACFIHLGLWTAAFGLELALFQRPWFGVANLLGLMLLLTVINNTKFAMLREPFFYPDFEYFTDAIKHPRLYLPFFGVGNAVLGFAAYGVALAAGLLLEAPLQLASLNMAYPWMHDVVDGIVDSRAGRLFVVVMGFVLAGSALVKLAQRWPIHVTFNAVNDLQKWGLLAALWRYRQEERRHLELNDHAPFAGVALASLMQATEATEATPSESPVSSTSAPAALVKPALASAAPLAPVAPSVAPAVTALHQPDLVVLQCESFFDVRRTYNSVRPDVLCNFDVLRAQAFSHGRLHVPAWGANTVRTEYAVLSGIDPARMGVHRYNPYRRLSQHAVITMAGYLQSLGYKTICVHPYAASFYRRNTTLPAMGFDVFLDIDAFKDSEYFGPYVSDKAVADKVIEILGEPRSQPLFVYVITMENHGPLHWESVGVEDELQFFEQTLPAGCEDLVAYVRHIANADRMIAAVSQALNQSLRPAGLCLFGDHVPIMPKVYSLLGEPDGTTDYLWWANQAFHESTVAEQAHFGSDVSERVQPPSSGGIRNRTETGAGPKPGAARDLYGQQPVVSIAAGAAQDLHAHQLAVGFLESMDVYTG